MRERWKDVAGYEGSYQVSDKGRVRSLDRFVGDGTRFYRGRVLRPCTALKYNTVYLCINMVAKTFYVHRLVATHFIPNPKNLSEVNHLKKNTRDNRASQLEWCTVRENRTHHQNSRKNFKKTSKYTGVSWYPKTQSWRVNISFNGKKVMLGMYRSEKKASLVYRQFLTDNKLTNKYAKI